MPKAEPRSPDLVEDLNLLIAEMRHQWQIGETFDAAVLIKPGKMLRSLHFAEAVLTADGLDPARETNWMRRIKRRFTARYGDSVTPEEYAGRWKRRS